MSEPARLSGMRPRGGPLWGTRGRGGARPGLRGSWGRLWASVQGTVPRVKAPSKARVARYRDWHHPDTG